MGNDKIGSFNVGDLIDKLQTLDRTKMIRQSLDYYTGGIQDIELSDDGTCYFMREFKYQCRGECRACSEEIKQTLGCSGFEDEEEE
jgi:hypothetical protein